MLRREARWLGDVLASIEDRALFPLLNVGSHTEHFRRREQPWIHRRVFAPLQGRGGRVVHTDLRSAPGVDVIGDLTDPAFRDHLRAMDVRSVLCCNVLEHVPDPAVIAASLTEIVPPGGHLVVSVPHRFPHHPDPIDTMFRPEPNELAALFPDLRLVRSAIVPSGTWLTYLASRIIASPRAVLTSLRARSETGGEPANESLWSWSFRRFDVTCVALQRAA